MRVLEKAKERAKLKHNECRGGVIPPAQSIILRFNMAKQPAAETAQTTKQPAKQATTTKKKSKRVVTDATVHISASFNNTIVTFTDKQGNVLSWASAGSSGFKGSRKSTPYAAQVAAEKAGNVAKEMGVKNLELWLRGPGPGRDAACRSLGALFKVVSLVDVTPIPHNGCRPRKRRRV
jgi:small subunit ribosomal protein S11